MATIHLYDIYESVGNLCSAESPLIIKDPFPELSVKDKTTVRWFFCLGAKEYRRFYINN